MNFYKYTDITDINILSGITYGPNNETPAGVRFSGGDGSSGAALEGLAKAIEGRWNGESWREGNGKGGFGERAALGLVEEEERSEVEQAVHAIGGWRSKCGEWISRRTRRGEGGRGFG
ncbi:hypothetical protein U1Q18_048483, partial [Sarracenia purpurea var. burkii]